MNIGLVIPTLNAGESFAKLLENIELQNIKISEKIIIDSGSVDDTLLLGEKYNYKIKYGVEHPTYYEISFIDGHKDTITVWTDPEYGDYIEMYDNGGVFTKGNIVLRYVPYKKYTRSDFLGKINLYNVLYYNKLKMRHY